MFAFEPLRSGAIYSGCAENVLQEDVAAQPRPNFSACPGPLRRLRQPSAATIHWRPDDSTFDMLRPLRLSCVATPSPPQHNKTMAHRMHRGMSPADVLRKIDDSSDERFKRALDACKPDALLTMLTDGEPCTKPAKTAALDALLKAPADAVEALQYLCSHETSDLDLYGAARRLPMAALMHSCGCGSDEQLEAAEDAGLGCVGDLIRYCADGGGFGDGDDDAATEQHVGALSLELMGAFDRPTIRKLVVEARQLVETTAKLPTAGNGGEWKGVGGLGSAATRAWEEERSRKTT